MIVLVREESEAPVEHGSRSKEIPLEVGHHGMGEEQVARKEVLVDVR